MQAWEEKILDQEKARKEGQMQKLKELVEKKVKKGYAAEEIAEMLEEDIETIQKLIEEL